MASCKFFQELLLVKTPLFISKGQKKFHTNKVLIKNFQQSSSFILRLIPCNNRNAIVLNPLLDEMCLCEKKSILMEWPWCFVCNGNNSHTSIFWKSIIKSLDCKKVSPTQIDPSQFPQCWSWQKKSLKKSFTHPIEM